MNQYPIVLIPEAVKKTKPQFIPKPIAPKSPQLPKSNLQSFRWKAILLFAGIGLSLSIGLDALIKQNWGIMIGVLISLFPLINASFQNQKRRKKAFKRKIDDERRYLVEKEEYEIKLELYNHQYNYWKNRIEKSRELLMKALSHTHLPDGRGSLARKGLSEKYLEPYLNRYFPGRIYTDLKIQNPNYSQGFHYTPDFAYIDPDANLHIDIEIDEPYEYKSRKPLHCIGQDEKRNRFFTNGFWVVIRFSEEQVIRYPERCCKKVAEIIADVTSDESILRKFANVSPLTFTPRWTVEGAKQMASKNYRQTYLKR